MATMTLAGLDVHDVTGIWLQLTRGYFEPAVWRGVDIVIPGADGRLPRNRRSDTRSILLEGYVMGSSESDFNANWTALSAVLAATDTTLATLVIGGGYLGVAGSPSIAVRWVPPLVANPAGYLISHSVVSVELESVTPNWS